MTEAYAALAYFTILTTILVIAALFDESLPPSPSDYKAKEREYLKWMSQRR